MAVNGRPALGRPWRRTVRYVLSRDRYRCQLHYPGTWLGVDGTERKCLGTATTADHIVPRSKGGSDRPANLRASCVPCNMHRGNHQETSAEIAASDRARNSRKWTRASAVQAERSEQ